MATKVDNSSSPLARDNCASLTISGRMPYFAGLKKLACTASRNRTSSKGSMRWESSATMPSSMIDDLERLGELQHARLREAVRHLAGVPGEGEKRDDENGAGDREIPGSQRSIGGNRDGHDGDDHLVDVVVERAQKLSPEKALEASVGQQFAVAADPVDALWVAIHAG